MKDLILSSTVFFLSFHICYFRVYPRFISAIVFHTFHRCKTAKRFTCTELASLVMLPCLTTWCFALPPIIVPYLAISLRHYFAFSFTTIMSVVTNNKTEYQIQNTTIWQHYRKKFYTGTKWYMKIKLYSFNKIKNNKKCYKK